jgi:hypothetical protein
MLGFIVPKPHISPSPKISSYSLSVRNISQPVRRNDPSHAWATLISTL